MSRRRWPAYREGNKHDRNDADAVLEHSNLMAQRDRLQQQRGMVRSSLPAIGTAPLVAIAMKAGDRQPIETTDESGRIKF